VATGIVLIEGGLKNGANGYRKEIRVLNGERQEPFSLVFCTVNVLTDPKFTVSVRFL